MEEKWKRLPDAELEVMLIIWRAGEPCSSGYILGELQGLRSWPLPTLLTVLARLTEKGFLRCEKQGRHNLYTPLVAEREYKQQEGSSFLRRLYGNSAKELVASLYAGGALTADDLAELRRYIEQLGAGPGKEGP